MDHVYKITELVGSSEKSIEDAIQTAISRASKTLRYLRWFEVEQIRGHIADDGVHHYQSVCASASRCRRSERENFEPERRF